MRISIITLLPLLLSPLAALAADIDLPTRSVDLEAEDLVARVEQDNFVDPIGKVLGVDVTVDRWSKGGRGNPGNKCRNNPLRDPRRRCECKEGLLDILGSCCCGDQKNTLLTLQGCGGSGGCDRPVCVCDAKNSFYDKKKHKCICKPGYKPTYDKKGRLKCRPPKPSDVPKSPKRELAEAISERKLDQQSDAIIRKVEDLIGCTANEKACQQGPAYFCTDIMSSLSSCGGCPDEAEDCAALPGVDEVRCERGQCVIDTCARGFTLTANGANFTIASSCIPKKSSNPWLQVQDRR